MSAISAAFSQVDQQAYQRRIRAWTMYDWANSAFATTIMAAVLPVYYSQVAGATLPSAAVATAYWSSGLSISILIVAILAPILGTISDVMRGKKRFLAIFFGLGTLGTGLLVLVDSGDWMLASLLFILGRIGFAGANVFYDALLPHIAKEEDLDVVSTRGYAMGYLGGGLLLAINIVMIQLLPGTWGARLSFLSVAIWWVIFSIPLFRLVPEPPAATAKLAPGETILGVSFKRLWRTIQDIKQYRELFKYLIAFLIYIDGVGTIIGVAAIYGAELGFGSLELILALLLVQFVGIPYSLIFGRLPSRTTRRRPFYLAFVLYNLIALPLVGIAGRYILPGTISGAPLPKYETTASAFGEGTYAATGEVVVYQGAWQDLDVPAALAGAEEDITYRVSAASDARLEFVFNGQQVKITHLSGPEQGNWSFEIDGQTLRDPRSGAAVLLEAYHPTRRYGSSFTIKADAPGEHRLTITNSGAGMGIASLEVLPPLRQSNLGLVLGLILAVQAFGFLLAFLIGPALFSGLAEKLDTRRSILLSLLIYTVIAIWGFFINSVVEFWFLAWMVAVVQGGSQALSRSLFSVMSPATKSGEFFGFFGIMEKFSAILGPLIFAFAAATFGNSRPAVLGLIAFFIIGGYLLTRVDVAEGRRVALAEDARLIQTNESATA